MKLIDAETETFFISTTNSPEEPSNIFAMA
jgi:hypothetical protein